MFVKEEGKESPVIINQEETAVLETEGGIRILLRTEAADKITASLEIRQEEEAAVFLHAFKQPEEPFFGPQTHLDPAKGVSYRMTLEGTGRLMAVYQHKNWWIRPAFPAASGISPNVRSFFWRRRKRVPVPEGNIWQCLPYAGKNTVQILRETGRSCASPQLPIV